MFVRIRRRSDISTECRVQLEGKSHQIAVLKMLTDTGLKDTPGGWALGCDLTAIQSTQNTSLTHLWLFNDLRRAERDRDAGTSEHPGS